jgi:hypothetical protein
MAQGLERFHRHRFTSGPVVLYAANSNHSRRPWRAGHIDPSLPFLIGPGTEGMREYHSLSDAEFKKAAQ